MHHQLPLFHYYGRQVKSHVLPKNNIITAWIDVAFRYIHVLSCMGIFLGDLNKVCSIGGPAPRFKPLSFLVTQ